MSTLHGGITPAPDLQHHKAHGATTRSGGAYTFLAVLWLRGIDNDCAVPTPPITTNPESDCTVTVPDFEGAPFVVTKQLARPMM